MVESKDPVDGEPPQLFICRDSLLYMCYDELISSLGNRRTFKWLHFTDQMVLNTRPEGSKIEYAVIYLQMLWFILKV